MNLHSARGGATARAKAADRRNSCARLSARSVPSGQLDAGTVRWLCRRHKERANVCAEHCIDTSSPHAPVPPEEQRARSEQNSSSSRSERAKKLLLVSSRARPPPAVCASKGPVPLLLRVVSTALLPAPGSSHPPPLGAAQLPLGALLTRVSTCVRLMVFYYTPRGADKTGHTIYVGKDKHENEELIKYGFPEDVWWHVDRLSSAHVYLRLRRGQSLADITAEELEDCCQLVKANSIEGHKASSVAVVYTPWANLRKTADMDTGQVGFHDEKAVVRVHVASRVPEVLNRLVKTKMERWPNLAAEEAAEREARAERKEAERLRRKEELEAARERARAEQARSYTNLMDSTKMVTNKEQAEKFTSVEEAEEDFM